MPKVTAIKAQVKRPDRYSVFLDGHYGFSLTSDQLVTSGLIKNQDLTAAEVADYQGDSEVGKAIQAAYRLLSYRSRSRHELTERLSRKGYSEEIIAPVMNRLEQLGLIDDQAFAQNWLARPKSKARSHRRLGQELRQKGLNSALITSQLETDGADHDYQAIKLIIEKRLKQNTPADHKRLLEYLVRQGFNYGLAKQVLAELSEAR